MGRKKGSRNKSHKVPMRKSRRHLELLSMEVDEVEFDDPEETLPRFDEKVLVAYRQRNYEKCIELIERILINNMDQCNKDHYKILQAASYTMIGQDFITAHSILDEVLFSDSKSAYAQYGKGVAFYFEKRFDESIEMLNNAIELNPQDMESAKDLKIRIDLEQRKPIIMIHKIWKKEDMDVPEDFEKFVADIETIHPEKLDTDIEFSSNVIENIMPNTLKQTSLVTCEVPVNLDEKKEQKSSKIRTNSLPKVSQTTEKDGNSPQPLQRKILRKMNPESNSIKQNAEVLQTTHEELFEQGMEHYKRGYPEKALKLFTKAVGIKPDFTEAEEMVAKVKELLELKDIADLNMAEKNYHAVIEICVEALEIDTSNDQINAHFFYQRGLANFHLGKTAESMKDYAKFDHINKMKL